MKNIQYYGNLKKDLEVVKNDYKISKLYDACMTAGILGIASQVIAAIFFGIPTASLVVPILRGFIAVV